MELSLYQIDAFARRPFSGNPAAVCPLKMWLPDQLMQDIAAENNLSETAFFVSTGKGYHIRWFTPTAEVRLCGHATLATAFVLAEILDETATCFNFASLSGPLSVYRDDNLYTLDFPAQLPIPCPTPQIIVEAFSEQPRCCLAAEDLLVIFTSEAQVAGAAPDLELLKKLGQRGVAIAAPGEQADFVTRFFAPGIGIPEDPVTGSIYTQLVPYWASETGRCNFNVSQISARGGELQCQLVGPRVRISGYACKYAEGKITIPNSY